MGKEANFLKDVVTRRGLFTSIIQRVAADVQIVGSGQTVNGMISPKISKRYLKNSIRSEIKSIKTQLHSVSVIFQRVAAGSHIACGGNKNDICSEKRIEVFPPGSLKCNSTPFMNPVLLFIQNSPKTTLKPFRV